jgi:hypothetical protein
MSGVAKSKRYGALIGVAMLVAASCLLLKLAGAVGNGASVAHGRHVPL